jgi:hypothetical protein
MSHVLDFNVSEKIIIDGQHHQLYNIVVELYCYTKVIRKVRKRWHQNPQFGQIGDGISEKQRKNVHRASSGHETQFRSKFGAKLSLPCPFVS